MALAARTARVVTLLAAVSAVLVALVLPATYYLVARANLDARLQTIALYDAAAAEQYINSRTDQWMLETSRLQFIVEELIRRHPDTAIAILDQQGRTIIDHPLALAPPVKTFVAPIHDFGVEVGTLVLSYSVDQIRIKTIILAVGGILLGFLIFVPLRLVPLRALQRESRLRLEAERETAAKSAYLENILRSSADMGIVATNLDFSIEYFNETSEKILGYKALEVTGRSALDFRDQEGIDQSRMDWVVNIIRVEGSHTFEFKRRSGEETRLIAARVSGIWDPEGDLIGYVLLTRDITDVRTAEAALVHKTSALERSNADLQQFAYVASHDLREPLRMVSSYLALLQRRFGLDLTEETHEYINFAVDGATRMNDLIESLVQYSRVETHAQPLAPTKATAALSEAMENLHLTITETGATVSFDDLPAVLGDPVQIMRVFQNLISNALKYRQPDRKLEIHVSATTNDDLAQFTIRDNGLGIEPKYFDRIFAIFQRLHPREDYEGTGIGLPICKRIVERHGGRIWVESEPGVGSAFHFTLPTS
ncbi:ATP-binding protein [Magnetospira sp. QH-2]|uniref:sensor histidine kinase n=1 Tax=Magnetospira sp. (strain QH-2) TaxID=1288970 RepID=UPI0003E815FB|nr:ATP-binding protein [Magnetospira sp. QH-2]CCQ74768.1 putative Histidine kinase with PAS sensor domain [Magnetospira sp. QH-2]